MEGKATKSSHLIDLPGKKHLLEQSDRPIVEGMIEEQIATVLKMWASGWSIQMTLENRGVIITGAIGGLGLVVSHLK